MSSDLRLARTYRQACINIAILTFIMVIFLSEAHAGQPKVYTFNLTKTIPPELSFKLTSADGNDISLVNNVHFTHRTDGNGDYPHQLEANFLEGAKIDSNIDDKKFNIKLERNDVYSVNGMRCADINNSCPTQSSYGVVNSDNVWYFHHTNDKPILELSNIKGNTSIAGFFVTHQRSKPFASGSYSEQWSVTITPEL